MIRVKRVYAEVESSDGFRLLVDRLWPRGIQKEKLVLKAWLKDLAPSNSLRRWFGHHPQKWMEFQKRYFTELEEKSEKLYPPLLDWLHQGRTLTLLYASKEERYNNAVALRLFLESKLAPLPSQRKSRCLHS